MIIFTQKIFENAGFLPEILMLMIKESCNLIVRDKTGYTQPIVVVSDATFLMIISMQKI